MTAPFMDRPQADVRSMIRGMRGPIAALLLIGSLGWLVSGQDPALLPVVAAPVGLAGLVLANSRTETASSEQAMPAAGWDAFERELDRSRRHERPLTLVVGVPSSSGSATLADVVKEARAGIRSLDAAWSDGSRLWIVFPEAGRGHAMTALARISRTSGVAAGMTWRLAVYPEDAIAAGGLVAHLGRAAAIDAGSTDAGSTSLLP